MHKIFCENTKLLDMLSLISSVTTVIEDRSIPIGGQIWIYDDKIKTKNFKYVANIVGKLANLDELQL